MNGNDLDIISLFQTVFVPVLMISGIGLFTLVVQTRYGRVVDRIRAINKERLQLIKSSMAGSISNFEKKWNDFRLYDLEKQMQILVRRGKLLKDSLQFMFISIFISVLSSLLIFVEQIIGIPLNSIVLLCFTFGMLLIFMSCFYILKEVGGSYNAVLLDIHTHVPKEYRVENTLDVDEDLEGYYT